MSEQEGNENNNSCNLQQFKRNLYFYGKLMSVKDFEDEQDYMNGKRRLVNRFVHGPGIIRGFGELALKNTGGNIEIEFTKGGAAFDCCGNEIVVSDGKVRPVYLGAEKLTAVTLAGGQYYLYLSYKDFDAEPVPTAANASSCEEKCCNSRRVEDFVVIASESPPDSGTIDCTEIPADYQTNEELRKWIDQQIKSLPSCEDRRVFLAAVIKNKSISNEDSNFVDIDETLKYRAIVYNNRLLSDLLRCHITADNPHKLGLEVEEAEGEKVEFSNGIITIEKTDAITLDADTENHKITIGESHSARTDNPHGVTAGQVEALESVNGVERDENGNVDLAQDNSITITPEPGNHRITIGETHSARTDNPHNITAGQVEALESVNGVERDGNGNVDLVPDDSIPENSITIAPDPENNQVKIGENHSGVKGNPHDTEHSQIKEVLPIFGNIPLEEADKFKEFVAQPVEVKAIDSVIGSSITVMPEEIVPPEFELDTERNKHVSNVDAIMWFKGTSHSTQTGNPHQTKHSEIKNVLPVDPAKEDVARNKHVSNADSNRWNRSVLQINGTAPDAGGMFTIAAGSNISITAGENRIVITSTGGSGTPGIGFENDLTFIDEIGWEHGGQMLLEDFLKILNSRDFFLHFSNPVEGVDERTFLLALHAPVVYRPETVEARMFRYDYIKGVAGQSPQADMQRFEFYVDEKGVDELRAYFIWLFEFMGKYGVNPVIHVLVQVKCDFILDETGRPAAGHHVGGSGRSGLHIDEAYNSRGGLFESWFSVVP